MSEENENNWPLDEYRAIEGTVINTKDDYSQYSVKLEGKEAFEHLQEVERLKAENAKMKNQLVGTCHTCQNNTPFNIACGCCVAGKCWEPKEPMTEEQIEEIKKHYTLPFEYCQPHRAVIDANRLKVAVVVCHFGKISRSSEDSTGQLIADLLNERLQPKQEGEG